MKDAIEAIVLIAFGMALVFLFKGEPSVFDVARDKVVKTLSEKTND